MLFHLVVLGGLFLAASAGNVTSSPFLNCLYDAGLDPVVQGDPSYADDATSFNLRYAYHCS